jgi:hypothetical protein
VSDKSRKQLTPQTVGEYLLTTGIGSIAELVRYCTDQRIARESKLSPNNMALMTGFAMVAAAVGQDLLAGNGTTEIDEYPKTNELLDAMQAIVDPTFPAASETSSPHPPGPERTVAAYLLTARGPEFGRLVEVLDASLDAPENADRVHPVNKVVLFALRTAYVAVTRDAEAGGTRISGGLLDLLNEFGNKHFAD